MSIANQYEPDPKLNNRTPTWELVVSEYLEKEEFEETFQYSDEVVRLFKERDEFGRNKHHVPLQPFNGRNSMNDYQAEVLDAIAYSRNLYEEYNSSPISLELWSCHLQCITMFENLILLNKKLEELTQASTSLRSGLYI